jgi:prophage DNA circulation protein
MASTREKLAGQAKVGGVEFWATGASGDGSPRRIVRYSGIGVEGQVTEDLGRDARVETLNAIVDEMVYIELKAVRDAAKVVTAVHPLFGVMQARLENVTYNAGPNDLVEIQVTLVENGDPSIFNPLSTLTLSGQTQDAKSAWSDLNDSFSELNALDSLTDDLGNAIGGFQDGWGLFDAALDLAAAGDVLFDEMASAYNDLADLGGTLIDAVDTAWNDVTELVDYAVEDLTYDVLNSARGVVDALEKQAVDVWSAFKVVDPVSIAEVALDFLGVDDDDTIQQILDRNPQIVDINAIPVGVEISVPVLT